MPCISEGIADETSRVAGSDAVSLIAKGRKCPAFPKEDFMYTAHVVSHTHWDREWYNPFQQFRMRLVDLTDKLIELMETDPDFKYFTFDGQTIVLEDYLIIRPENEQRLRNLIKAGRIIVGPWYNQPDEFLVSGESMIRNLLLGKKQSDDFGSYLASGYVPDAFGHMSQLPQIMRGFGIDNAILFRGITADQTGSEFIWRSPDGSEVLTIKMPDNNAYSNFFYRMRASLQDPDKPLDPDQVTNEVKTLVDDCVKEKPTTSQLLFMDGCDHVFAQFKTPGIIAIANERLDNAKLVHSTIADLLAAIRAENPTLETHTGELRWSNRDWNLQAVLADVMSSRIHLKQANHACETLLTQYVEPLWSWIWMMGGDYPRSYIDLAWKYLLQNHPHDSMCGCSVDQVHKDMVYRFDQVKQIGESLKSKALSNLAGKIGSKADKPERTVLAAVFNPLSHKRTDVVDTEIDFPGGMHVAGIRVIDPEGNEVPSAMLGKQRYCPMTQAPYDIPGGDNQKIHLAFVARDVPSVGYKAYRVEATEKPNRQPGTMLLGPDTAENEFLSVTIGSDGTFYLLDKETDAVFSNCLIFEDDGDFGDGWNRGTPLNDKVVTSLGAKTQVSVVENNAVRVVFEIDTEIDLPASRQGDGRSSRMVTCRAKTWVTLNSGAKRVDITTSFDNRAKDHRLRVIFPSGIPAKVAHAEGAFDVVERSIAVPPCTDWREPMPSAHPQKSFVDVSGGGVGLSLINKGLPQYEVKDDEARTIALTLLRAVGGGVRGPEQQVEGQVLGEHVFEYALYAHAGDWEEAESFKQAHAFNVPLAVGQAPVQSGDLPLSASLLDVNHAGFVLSAVKRSESGDALLVRGFNIGTSKQSVKMTVTGGAEAELVDLKEDPVAPLKLKGSAISFESSPKKIVTCRISRARRQE
jgi:alpha-mannosidase